MATEAPATVAPEAAPPVVSDAAATDTPKPARRKLQRHITRLIDGFGGTIEFIAEEKKSGAFLMFAKHVVRDDDGHIVKEKSEGSGMGGEFPSFNEAVLAAKSGAEAARKIGWQLRVSSGGPGGGPRKRDAFDLASLPKPQKAPKK